MSRLVRTGPGSPCELFSRVEQERLSGEHERVDGDAPLFGMIQIVRPTEPPLVQRRSIREPETETRIVASPVRPTSTAVAGQMLSAAAVSSGGTVIPA